MSLFQLQQSNQLKCLQKLSTVIAVVTQNPYLQAAKNNPIKGYEFSKDIIGEDDGENKIGITLLAKKTARLQSPEYIELQVELQRKKGSHGPHLFMISLISPLFLFPWKLALQSSNLEGWQEINFIYLFSSRHYIFNINTINSTGSTSIGLKI